MSKKKTPILSNLFFLLKFIWKINKRIYALNIFKVVLDIAQSLTTVIFLRYIVQYIIIDKNWTLTAIFVGALVVSLGITQILSSVIEPILRKDMDLLEKQILTQVGMTAIKWIILKWRNRLQKICFNWHKIRESSLVCLKM